MASPKSVFVSPGLGTCQMLSIAKWVCRSNLLPISSSLKVIFPQGPIFNLKMSHMYKFLKQTIKPSNSMPCKSPPTELMQILGLSIYIIKQCSIFLEIPYLLTWALHGIYIGNSAVCGALRNMFHKYHEAQFRPWEDTKCHLVADTLI